MRDAWPNARVRKNVSLIRTYHGFKGFVILQNSITILTYRYVKDLWKSQFDYLRYQTRSTRVPEVNIPSTLLVLGSPNSGSTCWLDPFQRQISNTRLVWGGKRQHWWLLSFFSLSCFRWVHAPSISEANRSIPWKRKLKLFLKFSPFHFFFCELLFIDWFLYGSYIVQSCLMILFFNFSEISWKILFVIFL